MQIDAKKLASNSTMHRKLEAILVVSPVLMILVLNEAIFKAEYLCQTFFSAFPWITLSFVTDCPQYPRQCELMSSFLVTKATKELRQG